MRLTLSLPQNMLMVSLMNTRTIPASHIRHILIVAISIVFALVSPGGDLKVFVDAGGAILAGHSPYANAGYYSPIWLALAAVPLAMLPRLIAMKLTLFVIGFVTFEAVCAVSVQRWTALILGLSPVVFTVVSYGNLDGVVLMAAFLPIPIAVWLTVLKPQTSIGLMILWFTQILRLRSGLQRVFVVFGPVSVMFLVSITAGMFRQTPVGVLWNYAIWPYGLPLGLVLLFYGLRKDDWQIAMAASPFLSPYHSQMGYMALVPLMGRRRWSSILFTLSTWIIVLFGPMRFL